MKYLVIALFVCFRAFGFETGLNLPANWKTLAPFHSFKLHDALPGHFDWRDKGGVTPVKDQGQCGSCWAFGSTAVMESAILRATGKEVILSEQELVSCDNSSYGCGGGFFAHDYQKSPGQSLESEFPYEASNVRCQRGLLHDEKLSSWSYIGDDNGAPSDEELKAAIVQYGPIAVTVSADSYWQNYRGGVLNRCTNGQTNHIVSVVGWDDKDGAWIVKNSWGESWGEKGYVRLKFGCDRIAEQATYVVFKP